MTTPEEIAKVAIGVEYMGMNEDMVAAAVEHGLHQPTEDSPPYGLGASSSPAGSPSHQGIMGGTPAWTTGNGVAPTITLPSQAQQHQQGSPPRNQGSAGQGSPGGPSHGVAGVQPLPPQVSALCLLTPSVHQNLPAALCKSCAG